MSNYTRYLRWGVIGALFLVLFVPFIIANGLILPNLFFPFITGKNFIFRIFVEFALLGYVLLACAVPKYRPKGSLVLWSVVALVAWMALATLTSVDPIKSFWSNFERMDGYIDLIHLFVWFVIAGAILTTDKLWSAFFETAIGASVLQGCLALFQVMHLFGFAPSSQSGARADTTFGNATYLAVYMLFSIFITLLVLANRAWRGKLTVSLQVWYALALVLQFAGLYFTETRGAQLGVIGGLVVGAIWVALFARDSKYRQFRKVAWYALGAIAIVVVGFVGVRNTSFVQHSSALKRLADISLSDPTVASRLLYIWPTAVKGIEDKPVVGWGEENFNFVFNKYYQPAMYNQEQWFDRAHNQFLDFGIAGGVPALLLYVLLFGAAAWTIWRSRLSVPEQAALMGLLAAYAFNNLFVFDNLVSFVYFFAILAFVQGFASTRPPRFMFLARPMGDHALAIIAPVALIVIGFGGWYLNGAGIARASTLVQALSAQGSPQANLALFQKAMGGTSFPGNQLGYQEAVEQATQLTANQVAQASIDPSIKQQYLAVASSNLQSLMAERPHDARLELFAGSLLSAYGAYDEAIQYLQQAVADSPQKQQILIQLGLVQLQKGDANDAIATLRSAFEEEPAYDTARILFASAYYIAGDTTDGDKLIIDKWGTTIVDNDQLLQVYLNTKLYSRAEAIWQQRIKNDPKNVQLYLGLASVYFQAGDKDSTVATLKELAQISPADAAQVQTLISKIQDGTLQPQ